jgi:predicted Fe-S protein YdhL (DUF1289 family)
MSLPGLAAEQEFPCVGICMTDPDSGYCLGCGRPPLPVSPGDQQIVVEELRPSPALRTASDPDSPGRS